MHRPTRIVVFGVLCLITGALSGMKNTMEAGLAYVGPDGLEQIMEMAKQQQGLPQASEQSLKVEIKAQRKPVYRIGQAVESTLSSIMALALIAAGIGLLRDRVWSLKLTRWWAFYAIPAAGISVVLSMRYALPEVPDAPAGGGVINGAFMLLVLWAFPILLLRVLPTRQVKDYLNQRVAQRGGQPVSTPIAPPAAPASPTPTDRSSSSEPAQTTWRDDPWNDPGSK